MTLAVGGMLKASIHTHMRLLDSLFPWKRFEQRHETIELIGYWHFLYMQDRSRSEISGKGVRCVKEWGGGGCFADFISFFVNIP